MVALATQDDPTVTKEFLRPVITGWLGAIKKAEDSKKWFNKVADQCEKFYSADMGFMWKEDFRSTFMSGKAPKFKITIAKAFEFVALYGPTLFWTNPTRELRPRDKLKLAPEHFLDYGQYAEQAFEQVSQRQQFEDATDDLRRQLIELYLNYTPNEQPNGGLAAQAKLAITEALISGRGCLWCEEYRYPGSDRTLTGLFYDSNRNLMIDPDAKMSDLSDARWIARKHISPQWEVERKFGYQPGSLDGRGVAESQDSQGRTADGEDRAKGKTYDLVEWYEVWSKCGVGYRLMDLERGKVPEIDRIGDAIEKTVGDYAYLCLMEGVPHPLNAHRAEVEQMDAEEMVKAFEWPLPAWIDNKWPLTCLDFYTIPDNAWPMAPLAPGLGELMFLNIMISHLAGRIWSSSRDFIAVAQSAIDDISMKLRDGQDLEILPFNDTLNKSIQEMIQVLQFPEVRYDVWRIIDRVSDMFDKRVGLTELLYGLNPGGVQSRSATDAENKAKYSSLRPDYMANCIDDWMIEGADLEKFAARWFVKGRDLVPLLGQYGAEMWDRHIVQEDPELVVRNMKARVVVNSSRKPNKEKDAANINQVIQYFLPIFQAISQATGDTSQINALIKLWGDANEMDTSLIEFQGQPPETQGPTPEELAMQQQQHEGQMQMEQMRLEGEQSKLQMESQAKADEHAMKMQQAEVDLQMKMMDAQVKQQMAEADIAFKQTEMQMDAEKAAQDMQVDRAKSQMEMTQAQESHAMNLAQSREAAKTKNQIAKQQARSKPSAGANRSAGQRKPGR